MSASVQISVRWPEKMTCTGTLTAQAYRLVPSAILVGGLDERHQPFAESEWCLQMIILALRSCMVPWQAMKGNARNQSNRSLLQRTAMAHQQLLNHPRSEAGNHQLCGNMMQPNVLQRHDLDLLAAVGKASLHAGMGKKHNRRTPHTRHPLPQPIDCQLLLCKRAHLRGI